MGYWFLLGFFNNNKKKEDLGRTYYTVEYIFCLDWIYLSGVEHSSVNIADLWIDLHTQIQLSSSSGSGDMGSWLKCDYSKLIPYGNIWLNIGEKMIKHFECQKFSSVHRILRVLLVLLLLLLLLLLRHDFPPPLTNCAVAAI